MDTGICFLKRKLIPTNSYDLGEKKGLFRQNKDKYLQLSRGKICVANLKALLRMV